MVTFVIQLTGIKNPTQNFLMRPEISLFTVIKITGILFGLLNTILITKEWNNKLLNINLVRTNKDQLSDRGFQNLKEFLKKDIEIYNYLKKIKKTINLEKKD